MRCMKGAAALPNVARSWFPWLTTVSKAMPSGILQVEIQIPDSRQAFELPVAILDSGGNVIPDDFGGSVDVSAEPQLSCSYP